MRISSEIEISLMLSGGVVPGGVVRGQRNPLHYGLPERLKKARKAAGLTRQKLSLAAGLARNAASDIEEERRLPLIDTVEQLAQALQLSPCALAYGQEGSFVPSDTLRSEGAGARLKLAREK